jgi:hypothetical protein
MWVKGGCLAANIGARALAGVRHTLVIDTRRGGWQAARTSTCRRQAFGVPHVCGTNSVSEGRATINCDHEYAFDRSRA